MPARPGRPVGWRKDVTRPHRVLVRLSEDERGWLLSRVPDDGTECDVIRGLIEEARMGDRVEECAYCTREVEVRELVPSVGDDDVWERESRQHGKDCEWVRTRAHQRD